LLFVRISYIKETAFGSIAPGDAIRSWQEALVPHIAFHLEATGLLFLNGADSATPEWRAPSVRGQVRYWLRALLGMALTDPHALWQAESAIMGSTEHGSTVTFRCPPPQDRAPQGKRCALTNTWLNLEITTRPGCAPDPLLLHALALWLSLGGIGKRSRRMYGGLQPYSVEQDAVIDWAHWNALQQPQDLAKLIQEQLQKAQDAVTTRFGPLAVLKHLPAFPTLHPMHSRVIVCTSPRDGDDPIDVAQKANAALFRFMHQHRVQDAPEEDFAHDPIIGNASPRRASPLIAQLRVAGNGYYPVLTVLRSPVIVNKREIAHWKRLDDFLDDIKQSWNGIEVWGSPWKGQHA
jgi:hypothetical protein